MKFINLHTHQYSNSPEIVELVNQYPSEFDKKIPIFSIGIHPWYINKSMVKQDLEKIEEVVLLKECLAIGECGLDKRIDIPLDLQIDVFEKQLLLAEKYNKPVILHCVAAFQEIIETKKRLNITVPIIIHGFSKNEQLADQLLKNGFYLSFGKYLLRNKELESVFLSVPMDKIFLETDTIEENIQEVYALAAKYKNIEIEELKNSINTNFKSVFQTDL